MSTKVLNLETGKYILFSCDPFSAVIAAYAQSKKDWNTWEYKKKYAKLVERSKLCFTIGDFTALQF